MKKRKLYLVLTNNTVCNVPLSMLGAGNLKDVSNVKTQYAFDFSAQTIGGDIISLQVRRKGVGDFQTLQVPLVTKTLQGIVDALNGSPYGPWAFNGNFLYTWSDLFEYGNLDITNSFSGNALTDSEGFFIVDGDGSGPIITNP